MTASRAPHRPRGIAAVGAVALALLATGCGEPASAVYRDAAVKTLEGSVSEARTAELAARLWLEGSSTHAFASVSVDGGEQGVGSDTSWFDDQQPPTRRDDRTRSDTLDALDAVADGVTAVRVGLARDDRAAVRTAVTDLSSACQDAEDLAERLS